MQEHFFHDLKVIWILLKHNLFIAILKDASVASEFVYHLQKASSWNYMHNYISYIIKCSHMHNCFCDLKASWVLQNHVKLAVYIQSFQGSHQNNVISVDNESQTLYIWIHQRRSSVKFMGVWNNLNVILWCYFCILYIFDNLEIP